MRNTKITLIIIQVIFSIFFNPLHPSTKATKLSTRDIISKNIFFDKSFRKQVFNKVTGFNGKTYTRKVNYYIHLNLILF